MMLSRRSFLRLSGAAGIAPLWPKAFFGEGPQLNPLCRRLAADPLRPQFHLLPASNWMNDPNGPIFFGGQYHMFHQYNPKGAVWGNMHWAHAVSPDMVQWRHQPIAIAPTPDGYDRDGVFSGSAVLDQGVPTVIYTGVLPPRSDSETTLRDGVHTWREVQCLAVSHDPELRTWEKLAAPVIAAPPPDLPVAGFRDPCVWREEGSWWLILGSGFRGRGGAILLYRSEDLRNWHYMHPLVEGAASGKNTTNPVDTGDMWECPDFFPMGDQHVLLISAMGKVHWKVGTYKDKKFSPEKEGTVDYGSYYAAKSMLDKDGNRILWGWIPETRPESEYSAAGWAGVMAIPRVLSLNSENELVMEILPAVQQLRREHSKLKEAMTIEAMKQLPSDLRLSNLSAELLVELHTKVGRTTTLRLAADNQETFASIAVGDGPKGRVLNVNGIVAPLSGASGSVVRLHALLDASVLEVLANGTAAVTARVYRAPSGPLRLHLDGDPRIPSLDIWQMEPISKNRLTSPLCD
jgi:beta-fructofuranosidase